MGLRYWRNVLVVALFTCLSLDARALEAPLIEAVKNANTEAVRALLKRATDVNTPAIDGATALHWAVFRNNLELVDVLIQAGARVTVENRYGATPLSLAAVNGNQAIVERLLKAGADPNAPVLGDDRPLMIAARTGPAGPIKALLAHGAQVNARVEGQTALMWAADRNNVEAIRTLVEAGADVQARTSPLESGSRQPGNVNKERLSTFMELFAMPEPTSYTALLFAARAGALDAVRSLLAVGADVNDTLSDGQSALMIAAANAHWSVADLLLDKGADPNLYGAGWNALHQAIKVRRPNRGKGLPGPIPTGSVDSIEVIKKIVARGVDINARMTIHGLRDIQRNRFNRLGATAFLLAAKANDTEVMRVLIDAGADPSIRSADGTTPLMVAAGLHLYTVGEDGGSMRGQEFEVLEAVKMCVALGNDVNAENIYGETALHGAALRGQNNVVEYLVEQGAALAPRDERGWTPWSIANGLSIMSVYRLQPDTADLLKRLMGQQGLSTEGQEIDPRVCHDCIETIALASHEFLDRMEMLEKEYARLMASGATKTAYLDYLGRRTCAAEPHVATGVVTCEWNRAR